MIKTVSNVKIDYLGPHSIPTTGTSTINYSIENIYLYSCVKNISDIKNETLFQEYKVKNKKHI